MPGYLQGKLVSAAIPKKPFRMNDPDGSSYETFETAFFLRAAVTPLILCFLSSQFYMNTK